MFIGNFQHNIDDNGRFCIPAQFREELGENFVAVKGDVGFVVFFPTSEFNKRCSALHGSTPEAKALLYNYMTSSHQMVQDKQGRAVIPAALRNYADITQTVYIVGMVDQIFVSAKILDNEQYTPRDMYYHSEEALEKKEQKRLLEAL